MICKKCGAQVSDDSLKCEFCGEVFVEEPTQKIDINESTEQSEAVPVPASEEQRSTHEIFEENARKRKEQVEKAKDERQIQLEEITERRNAKKNRQQRNKKILIAVLCAVVVVAAGVGTYYVKNGNSWGGTVVSTPNPSVSPIPTLAPVATPVPVPSQSPEATQEASQTTTASQSEENVNWTATNPTTSSGSNQTSSASAGSSSSGGSSASVSTPSTSSSGGYAANGDATVSSAKPSGVVNSNISAKLAVGGQVINDSASGNSYMTFVMNNTTYYANVEKGSITEQVKNKYMTVTAIPTNGRYNGNTVYEITSLTYYDGADYIIPDSGIREIKKSEIQSFTKEKLGLARNEIYARHGRKFQMQEYQQYFKSKSWYKVNPNYNYNDDNKNLNSIELKNVETILSVENSK